MTQSNKTYKQIILIKGYFSMSFPEKAFENFFWEWLSTKLRFKTKKLNPKKLVRPSGKLK